MLMGLLMGKHDLLTVDVALPSAAPVVLALMKNSERKRMTEDYRDLAASSVSAVAVPALAAVKVSVLADSAGAVDALLGSRGLLDAIVRHADLFVSLHVTDRSTVYAAKTNMLRAVLRLPSSAADQARCAELLAAVLGAVDTAATLKPSRHALARAAAARQAEKRARQQQEAEERRAAATKAREEKREREYQAMTPEQREKAEQRERKRKEKRQRVRVVAM